MAVFFTSDLHLGHANILNHTERPWDSLEEMNEGLIANINASVGLNDELWILGDFSFKIPEIEAEALAERILCQNVHLIRGNHDKGHGQSRKFRSVSSYEEIKPEGQKLCLIHYPLLEWNGSRHGHTIHLHGHIHSDGSYNERMRQSGIKRFDVGVDANNYSPVPFEKIIEWAAAADEVFAHERCTDENERSLAKESSTG